MAHDFGMLWKHCGFLNSNGDKIKNSPYAWELLDTMVFLDALAIIKILGYSKLDSLEAKGNHLADISAKNTALKGVSGSQTSVMVQREAF